MATAVAFTAAPLAFSSLKETNRTNYSSSSLNPFCRFPSHSSFPANLLSLSLTATNTGNHHGCFVVACLPSSTERRAQIPTKLYVSGLSFRTSEESLRNAFQNFGQLVQVNLVMDRIANRPRGFAFLQYATEEESKKAIEGMHGKFLDGRVIFVEVAKPRSEMRQGVKQNPRMH